MYFSQERTYYIITSCLPSFKLGQKTRPFATIISTLVLQPSCLLFADNYVFLWVYSIWKHIFLFSYVVTQPNKFNSRRNKNIYIGGVFFQRNSIDSPCQDCACGSPIYKSCALMHSHKKGCKLNPFSKTTNCWQFWLLFTDSTFQCSPNPFYFLGF